MLTGEYWSLLELISGIVIDTVFLIKIARITMWIITQTFEGGQTSISIACVSLHQLVKDIVVLGHALSLFLEYY